MIIVAACVSGLIPRPSLKNRRGSLMKTWSEHHWRAKLNRGRHCGLAPTIAAFDPLGLRGPALTKWVIPRSNRIPGSQNARAAIYKPGPGNAFVRRMEDKNS